ncbi:hypothetical protein FD754_025193, partial [Muntiacus muntjak]
VLLMLSPTSVAVGTLFTIECRVPAVGPPEGLTVTLLRDAMVTHNTTAHREDGLYNFSCEALMDLRSRGGGLVHRVSDPQRLEVKEPMPDNQMVTIIVIMRALLLLFATFILLCFVFTQRWRHHWSHPFMENRWGNQWKQ